MLNFIRKGAFIMTCLCALTGCVTPQERRGAVCFTFDDYHGEKWLAALPLFEKYQAHATFFIVREITAEKAEVMKKLQAAGHTVGLHTLHHRDAVPFVRENGPERYLAEEVKPQLDACAQYGITVRSFAYPNNRRDEETDRMLFPYFDHLRAGNGPARQPLFYPLETLPEKSYLGGTGIGTYYNSDPEALKKLLDRAAETGSLIVFFSHSIHPGAEHIHMPTEWLEQLLAHARKLNLHIIGFDEINPLLKQCKAANRP